jgi:hypothetical protein
VIVSARDKDLAQLYARDVARHAARTAHQVLGRPGADRRRARLAPLASVDQAPREAHAGLPAHPVRHCPSPADLRLTVDTIRIISFERRRGCCRQKDATLADRYAPEPADQARGRCANSRLVHCNRL